jgi:hypothetical protein
MVVREVDEPRGLALSMFCRVSAARFSQKRMLPVGSFSSSNASCPYRSGMIEIP